MKLSWEVRNIMGKSLGVTQWIKLKPYAMERYPTGVWTKHWYRWDGAR